jgi:hypothetical protein
MRGRYCLAKLDSSLPLHSYKYIQYREHLCHFKVGKKGPKNHWDHYNISWFFPSSVKEREQIFPLA